MAISAKPSGTLSRRLVTSKPAVKPHWPGALAMRQPRALHRGLYGYIRSYERQPLLRASETSFGEADPQRLKEGIHYVSDEERCSGPHACRRTRAPQRLP